MKFFLNVYKPIGINNCFFEKPDDGGGSGNPDNPNPEPNDNDDGNPPGNENKKEYTQEELNRMMAKEKREGRNSILRQLGIISDDEKNNKKIMETFKNWYEEHKTDADKIKDYENLVNKNNMLEIKIEALSLGANPEYLDDLLSLASTKVKEGTTISDVLKELKSKYPNFFNVENNNDDKGTGKNGVNKKNKNNNNNDDNDDDDETFASRFAKSNDKNKTKKNIYFRN